MNICNLCKMRCMYSMLRKQFTVLFKDREWCWIIIPLTFKIQPELNIGLVLDMFIFGGLVLRGSNIDGQGLVSCVMTSTWPLFLGNEMWKCKPIVYLQFPNSDSRMRANLHEGIGPYHVLLFAKIKLWLQQNLGLPVSRLLFMCMCPTQMLTDDMTCVQKTSCWPYIVRTMVCSWFPVLLYEPILWMNHHASNCLPIFVSMIDTFIIHGSVLCS